MLLERERLILHMNNLISKLVDLVLLLDDEFFCLP
jgi:hypothetical protein